jgi:anti-anti-sigma factor
MYVRYNISYGRGRLGRSISMRQSEGFSTRLLQQQDFRICSVHGVPVVSTSGEIDLGNIYQLCRALWEARAGTMVVVMDMTATSLCDGTSLGYLTQVKRWLENSCVELRVVGCPESVRRIRDVLGDDRLLPVFENLAEAVTMKPRGWWLHYQAA